MQVRVHICTYGVCCQTLQQTNLATGWSYVPASDWGNCGQLDYHPLDISQEDVTLKIEHSGSQAWSGGFIHVGFPGGRIAYDVDAVYDNDIYPLVGQTYDMP